LEIITLKKKSFILDGKANEINGRNRTYNFSEKRLMLIITAKRQKEIIDKNVILGITIISELNGINKYGANKLQSNNDSKTYVLFSSSLFTTC
jgi:hypothetical protein